MSNKPEDILRRVYPAKVIKVLDYGYKLVINRGAENGIKKGQRFLVYHLDEELYDPDTGKSLGTLEVVRGTGIVTHVQENLATIESDVVGSERTIKKSYNPLWKSMGETGEEIVTPTKAPFDSPKIGDLAKPI
ncbi:FlgT C-terminal domain-containing protein [Bacillus mycoides]|uniref:FlgT C-terminal domain-containing protein n=1 Tax=Bacillus mycoides TaxID=1405 RepID=UPI002DFCD59E|nr:FlgT C-terminal domain-containing protein [Bacillus mycoides]MEC5262851.1 FlgT C-terminal domain-containing protein [Bacillus mycoides]